VGIVLSPCIKLVCLYTILFAIDVEDEDVGHCDMCYAYHTRPSQQDCGEEEKQVN